MRGVSSPKLTADYKLRNSGIYEDAHMEERHTRHKRRSIAYQIVLVKVYLVGYWTPPHLLWKGSYKNYKKKYVGIFKGTVHTWYDDTTTFYWKKTWHILDGGWWWYQYRLYGWAAVIYVSPCFVDLQQFTTNRLQKRATVSNKLLWRTRNTHKIGKKTNTITHNTYYMLMQTLQHSSETNLQLPHSI